jgi:primosomal replication protein N
LSSNRCIIDGELLELDVLRYTPAGIPRVGLKIRHVSSQLEAGITRQLSCTISAVAMGDAALQVTGFRPGQSVQVEGFLAQRSLRVAQLVLHINHINLK